jgi:hypothetical protein
LINEDAPPFISTLNSPPHGKKKEHRAVFCIFITSTSKLSSAWGLKREEMDLNAQKIKALFLLIECVTR